jgi:hypothetical protein
MVFVALQVWLHLLEYKLTFICIKVRRFNELSEKAKARLHNKPKTEFVSEAQRSASLEFMPDTKKPVAAPKVCTRSISFDES